MHKIEIIETKTLLNYPESGQEFTREQLIKFARLLVLYQSGELSFHEFKIKLTYALLNLVRTANVSKPENAQLLENINQISKLNNQFFTSKREKGKEFKVVNMDFIINLLPTVSVNGKTFHGPTDALFNTVYGEYLQVIMHLNEFAVSGSEDSLNQLIATIYRPQKPNYNKLKHQADFDGDIRIKFNPNLTQNYAQDLAQLPFEVKYAIFLFVASSQHFIANSNALDIGGGNTIDLTLLFSQQSNTTQPANSLGMVGTLYSLAETKVFGTVKDVAEQNTYDILAYLVNQKTEHDKLKRKNHATTN
ncbi:hypothetical protein [Thalassobellus citreus]|uniref:hypothetical protein n=1 Tax=Thalassobellus citreus TaxID=3367752 RepID=UPI0037AE6CCC